MELHHEKLDTVRPLCKDTSRITYISHTQTNFSNHNKEEYVLIYVKPISNIPWARYRYHLCIKDGRFNMKILPYYHLFCHRSPYTWINGIYIE